MAGIYIHIPFCRSKCGYCDFFSVASLKQKQPVVDAIIREVSQTSDYLRGESIRTLYFGGGTPSLLDLQELSGILEEISRNHHIDSDCEITIEANPDDFSRQKLADYKALGLGRISLGIQSFHASDLQYLDRRHDMQQAEEALALVAGAGFSSFNIDLIYSIPGQTPKMLDYNIRRCVEHGTPHLSCYSLTVEPRTALNLDIGKGRKAAPAEEAFREHFIFVDEALTAHGYLHYEISNFAMPGHFARHNLSYWRSGNYLGLGPSAHSFNGTSRRWNHSSLKLYVEGIAEGSAPAGEEKLSATDRCNEMIMTRLRTMWGLSLEEVEREFGRETAASIRSSAAQPVEQGLIIQEGDVLLLTAEGQLLSDSVISSLFTEPARHGPAQP